MKCAIVKGKLSKTKSPFRMWTWATGAKQAFTLMNEATAKGMKNQVRVIGCQNKTLLKKKKNQVISVTENDSFIRWQIYVWLEDPLSSKTEVSSRDPWTQTSRTKNTLQNFSLGWNDTEAYWPLDHSKWLNGEWIKKVTIVTRIQSHLRTI